MTQIDGTRPLLGAPIVALGVRSMSLSPGLRLAVRLGELGLVLVVTLASLLSGTTTTVGLVGIVVSGLAWLAWVASGDRPRPVAASLMVMATAGGVAAGERLPGVMFVGVAAAGAAFAFDLLVAVALVSPSMITFVLVILTEGTVPSRPWLLAAVGLLGIVSGGGRRQLLAQGRQVALAATVARREVALMAERNRLGRELHDVLAHTLGAVSIQLTALDSRVAAGDGAEAVQARIGAIHRLVGDGLDEARAAVSALREDGPPLVVQLGRLCDLHDASLAVAGPTRNLDPEATLTLYRVAQEALTNVDKHAPRAPASVRLTFDADAVAIAIGSGNPVGDVPSPLARSGGGHGLDGLRERVELIGGRFDAGPTDGGWHVDAELCGS